MNIQAEKLFLIEQLTKVQDENIIKRIKKILSVEKEQPVGYSNGKPIYKKQLIERIDAAEERIARGEGISHEDAVKQASHW